MAVSGLHVGSWTLGDYAEDKVWRSGKKSARVHATCACGTQRIVDVDSLMRGASKSCGDCLGNASGQHDPEYRVWVNMRSRCRDPKHTSFRHYGGRGIRVCDEWEKSYWEFRNHIGPRPSADHSIERIDVNGHYEPGNVRWATKSEPAGNRRPREEWPEKAPKAPWHATQGPRPARHKDHKGMVFGGRTVGEYYGWCKDGNRITHYWHEHCPCGAEAIRDIALIKRTKGELACGLCRSRAKK